jgi:hypothetical protein
MSHDPIGALISGRWPDPDGGKPLGVPTRAVVIEKSLAGDEADLVRELTSDVCSLSSAIPLHARFWGAG